MSYEPAPEHPLPSTPFYSVEYPGYVQSSSIQKAVRTLGGNHKLNASFRKNAPVELKFHPDNPFSHPVSGDVVRTSNLVLKVTKRKKKKPATEMMMDIDDGPVAPEVAGEYTTEVVGSTSKTIRFRSM
jgi:general transcription factor 3C polypeptide 5 (transcription factor C subunit 1)